MNLRDDKPPPLSRHKRLVFSIIISAFVVSVIGLGAETLTRLRGFTPLKPVSNIIAIDPPGKYFIKHPTRGYAHLPGEFKITTDGPYTFTVTHLDNGLRITHRRADQPAGNKKELWIFGCSYTHGWRLNDDETYPWLLQRDLSAYEVINFGVDGYGDVQSLIQFKESLKTRSPPVMVVVSYASFHDTRNRLTRSWRKARLNNSRMDALSYPYARLGPNNELLLMNDPLKYPGLTVMRYSALANYLDNLYNSWTEARDDSHEISKAVLNEFWNLCKAHGIKFVLAGIFADPKTAEMLTYFKEKGVSTVDISVDMTLKENSNLPYDVHPSAIANQQYARKLETFLLPKLMDTTGKP
jgi:hypothetical protein